MSQAAGAKVQLSLQFCAFEARFAWSVCKERFKSGGCLTRRAAKVEDVSGGGRQKGIGSGLGLVLGFLGNFLAAEFITFSFKILFESG